MKWSFIAGLATGALLMGLVAAYHWFYAADAKGIIAFLNSWNRLQGAAAQASCAGPQHYQEAAARYGWKTEEVAKDSKGRVPVIIGKFDPNSVGGAMRIHVEPEMPFAKDRPFLYFDKNGCVISY